MTDEAKGKPIPTRFDPPEQRAITELKKRTGMAGSEIVRRAMRLLKRRVDEEGGDLNFLVQELAPDYGADKGKVVKLPSPRRKVIYPEEKKRKKRA